MQVTLHDNTGTVDEHTGIWPEYARIGAGGRAGENNTVSRQGCGSGTTTKSGDAWREGTRTAPASTERNQLILLLFY